MAPRGNTVAVTLESLVEEWVDLAGSQLCLLRPREAYYLIDEEAFDEREFLPYWAELWPSGVALAGVVSELDLTGLRVLELGAGLGLPSLAAALKGAEVLATDWAPDAVELLRENAARNRLELRAACVSWEEPGVLQREAPWDLVLAADVLYERRNADRLRPLLSELGRETLLADPGRRYTPDFLTGFEVERIADLVYRLI
jgi:predicted nicotinamide N-methyase